MKDIRNTPDVLDIFLQPGDFYFGDRYTRIRTLLGSCVSITMWHPQKKIGGMCHYMLPSRQEKNIDELSGRYADEAIAMFYNEIHRNKTKLSDYVVKLFGGGKMYHGNHSRDACHNKPCHEVMHRCQNVSCRNVAQSRYLLEEAGIEIDAHDLGGTVSRNIIFDVATGDVWVRQNSKQTITFEHNISKTVKLVSNLTGRKRP